MIQVAMSEEHGWNFDELILASSCIKCKMEGGQNHARFHSTAGDSEETLIAYCVFSEAQCVLREACLPV
jgi:hypothetical protein